MNWLQKLRAGPYFAAFLGHSPGHGPATSSWLSSVGDFFASAAQVRQASSKPPSSGGLHRPQPKSLRKPGQKPSGGQKGHQGHTLRPTDAPDHIEVHAPPEHCDACGTPLPQAVVVETRQVFDLPTLRHEVTEHQMLKAVCTCGKAHRRLCGTARA